MKFPNKASAIKFIEASGISIDEKVVLCDLIEKHALDREIVVIGTVDALTGLMFEADHDVEDRIELNDIVIDVHSLAGVSSVNNTQSKEIKMTNEQNNQAADQANLMNEMEKIMAETMKNIMSSSMDDLLAAALKKQQERIDEAVKKTVDEAVKKAVDEALKAKAAEAPKTEAPKTEESKKETPKEESKSKDESISIGKIAGYVAGAAAVGAGGFFAWKKWGAGSSAV